VIPARPPRAAARCAACVALGLASVLGCTRTETEEKIVHVYDPYEGPPVYPNRRPTFELPAGDVGLVSNNGSDTISVLDLTTNQVLGSAPVGRDPVDIDGPHHLAGDRARGVAFVALAYPAPALTPGPHAAHGSSVRDGFVQKLALDDLRVLGEVRVDKNPGDIVLSDDGARIVVSHFDLQKALTVGAGIDDRRATLAVIDSAEVLASGSPDAARITTCVAPHGVALSRPDGARAYVACYGEDVIAVVDVTDPKAEVLRVPVGPSPGGAGQPTYGPYSAVLSPGGQKIALGNTESKDVRVFDVAASAMTPIVIQTLGAPYFMAWSSDETLLYIPTQSPDALVVADAATGTVVASRPFDKATCQLPHETTFNTDDSTLYIVCEGDHKLPGVVLGIDPSTLDTTATLPVGVYPDRLAILRSP
jgi:YVTN family beta-propeller protein